MIFVILGPFNYTPTSALTGIFMRMIQKEMENVYQRLVFHVLNLVNMGLFVLSRKLNQESIQYAQRVVIPVFHVMVKVINVWNVRMVLRKTGLFKKRMNCYSYALK